MAHEFRDSTYESETLIEDLYRDFPENFDGIVNIIVNEIKAMADFPISPERATYSGLKARLNKARDVMQRLGALKNSVYKDVAFEVYDNVMKEGVGPDESLKPDLIARDCSLQPKKASVTFHPASWTEVEFAVEVKSNWRDLVGQAATYARCLFTFQRSRLFTMIIFFNHATQEVRFGVFTSAWLCASTAIVLSEEEGIRQFAASMVRIYACQNRTAAGFDPFCNNRFIYIPGKGEYAFRKNLCCRASVRGRRTRVDIIELGKESGPQGVVRKSDRYQLRTLKAATDYSNSGAGAKSSRSGTKGSIGSGSQPKRSVSQSATAQDSDRDKRTIGWDWEQPIMMDDSNTLIPAENLSTCFLVH